MHPPLSNPKKWRALRLGAMLLLTVLMMTGCGRKGRVVVYADPWLEDYAARITEEFQREYPGVEVKLKVLSSEVVFQHLHYGEPMDVFLCFGDQWFPQPEWKRMVDRTVALAGTRAMEVQRKDTTFLKKQQAFGSQGCRVLEASDRAMRRYAESAFGPLYPSDTCSVIANFQSQLQAYLLRGWVPRGYVPAHFMRQAPPGHFVTQRNGPWIPAAFSAILLRSTPNPEAAQAFFAFVQSEKSAQILGELGFLP
jgi:ABC-type molybdate transport system substrate-binding protein